MVQMLWLGAADLPARAPEKDWDLQASPQALCCPKRPNAKLLAMDSPCPSCRAECVMTNEQLVVFLAASLGIRLRRAHVFHLCQASINAKPAARTRCEGVRGPYTHVNLIESWLY